MYTKNINAGVCTCTCTYVHTNNVSGCIYCTNAHTYTEAITVNFYVMYI